MSLSSLSIRRPVFTLVLSAAIVLFGAIGFQLLGVREFPAVQRPIISVTAGYPGASANVIENQITEPLEEEINTVAGITSINSVSRDGRSTVTVEFDIGFDLDVAANDVRDRVASAVRRLPPDIEPPVVEKADADGDPIIFLNVRSDTRSLLELTDIADRLFKPRLQTIEGVARVDIWGNKEYAMRLWLDPGLLTAHGLTVIDVRDALRRANVELPSGLIEGEFVELSVRTLSRLGPDPEEFNNIVLRQEGDRAIRLIDVGRAEIGPLNLRTVLKRNGVQMVGVVLRPQVGANEIEIVDEFHRRLARIKLDLPPDVDTAIGFDTSIFIRRSIAEVKQTIFIALVLVCLTIFFFLREWRSSVIPLLTIPIALTGAFFVMYLAGFTINVLTLLGLVLAIGLVVDDAIVVLENIYAKIERGNDAIDAGIKGIREIFLAVVATTLALVAVFLPLVFLGGLTGVLFSEFGITLAAAVVISSFVALTLTPMLCSRILRKHDRMPAFYRRTEPFFESLNTFYQWTLGFVLRHRWMAVLVFFVCGGLTFALVPLLPRELAPLEDRSLLVARVIGPQGANFEYMAKVMDELDALVAEQLPERHASLSVTSPGFGAASTVNSGFSRITLSDPSERNRSQAEAAAALTAAFRDFPPAQAFVSQQPTIQVGRSRGLPVQFVVQNPSFDKLAARLPEFLAAARARPEFSFVTVDLEFNRPEVELQIDRTRAENLGISASDIAESVQAALSGQRFGFFLKDGKQYEMIGQIERDLRGSPMDLTRIHLRGNNGSLVSLDNLVEIRGTTVPAVLYRTNRFPSATVSANPAPGRTLGEGIAAMREVTAEVLDSSFTTELAGESLEFERAGGSLFFVFLLALALVYLVLAAQFESFRDPFIIMLTVPLALAGGLVALWITGQTLNIFSQIGLVMLIGLVTKNGILIVEFANQRRDAGLERMAAIRDASAARLRPILMTAISTILGVTPIALAAGAGAQSRIPLGVAVIGGMLLGTLLTLYVIPCAYSVLSPVRHARRQE